MKTTNGWDVYLRIKELSNSEEGVKPEISVDALHKEFRISAETMNEYLAALAVLKFIEFTDKTKTAFVITDQG